MSEAINQAADALGQEIEDLDRRRALLVNAREALRSLNGGATKAEPPPSAKKRKKPGRKTVAAAKPPSGATEHAAGAITLGDRIAAVVRAARAPISTASIFTELERLGVKTTYGSVSQTIAVVRKAGKIIDGGKRGLYAAPAEVHKPQSNGHDKVAEKKPNAKHDVEEWAGAYRCRNCFEEREQRKDYFSFACEPGE